MPMGLPPMTRPLERRGPDELLRFIAEAGRSLHAPTAYDDVVGAVARVSVPRLADLAVLILPADGAPEPLIAVAHRDPATETSVRDRLRKQQAALIAAAAYVVRTAGNRRTYWLPDLTTPALGEFAGPDPRLQQLRDELDLGSLALVSLWPGSGRGAVLALGRLRGQPPLAGAELAAASVLGQRSALALDNARLRRAAERDGQAARRLEKTLMRWSHVFQAADWGAAILTPNGQIEVGNPALGRLLGRESDALVGQALEGFAVDEDRVALRERLQHEPGAFHHQARFERVGGQPFPALVSIAVVNDPASTGSFRVVSMQDISDIRRTEERLHGAQRMEAVGRLAGGVAHEVNNMMTIILGFADFLSESASAEQKGDVEEIRKAAVRAADMTRQLLAYGRQQVLRPTVLDLSRVVSEMASVLHPLLPADIALETRTNGVALVRADRTQLEQVLINLAFNARDAMPRGGRLVICAEAKELDEKFIAGRSDIPMAPGAYGLLTVRDSGTGMSPETSASIFEPFFTTKAVGHGTGLGLSTVYGIVKQSGGFIWVDSTPGEGTEFTICLPLMAEEGADRTPAREARAAGAATAPLEPGRGVILVVEDDDTVRTVMRRTLREGGYSVLEAVNGSQATHILSDPALAVDLVVTDLVMPEMGGADLRTALRASRPGTPVLSISAYPFEDLRRRGLLEADDPFLQKPYTRDSLIRLVQSLTPAGGVVGRPDPD